MRQILCPDLCSECSGYDHHMFCVTRVDDNPQDFGLFKAKQRENPKKDVFLIQGFCLEKLNSSRGL